MTENTAWPSAGGWYADIAVRLIATEPTQSSNCFRAHKQVLHSWYWNAADGPGKSSRWNAQQKTRAAYNATSLNLPLLFSRLPNISFQHSDQSAKQQSSWTKKPVLFFLFLIFFKWKRYRLTELMSITVLRFLFEICRSLWDWSFLPCSVVLYKQTILCPCSK